MTMSLMLKLVLLFLTVLASLIWVILPPNEPQAFQKAPRSRRLRALETNSSAVVAEQVDAVALSADGTLLNTMIQVALPFVNAGIKQITPDPLDLNIAGTLDIGTIDFGCGKTGVRFPYNWGGVNGLSNFFIQSLEVKPGTENVEAGISNTLWSATFNMAVASLADFDLDDLGVGVDATVCGVPLNQNIGGNIITTKPFMSGSVDLAGSICNGLLNIDYASILDSLIVDYGNISAELQNVPALVQAVVSDVTNQLSVLFRDNGLIGTVEPTMRPIIEQQLKDQTTNLWQPAKLFRINAGFVRNAAQRRIGQFWQDARQIVLGASADGVV